MNEIEILKTLDHPNILKLYEFYQDEKRYYLVTELCTGDELFDETTKRPQFTERDHGEKKNDLKKEGSDQ